MIRKITASIEAHLNKPQHTIVTGARQLGKTTMLKQVHQNLENRGQKAYYFTLEAPDVLHLLNEHPENLFKLLPKQETGKVFLLIDEVQYLANPTNFLKYHYDLYKDRLKIIATGSSAFYIDSNFKDSLAGRKKIVRVDPLNFEEFLLFKEQKMLLREYESIKSNKDYLSSKSIDFKRMLEEYLIYGGYPEVVLQEKPADKIELLNELKSSFLKKDILESQVEDETKFRDLFKLLAAQLGSLVNKNELCSTLRLAEKTVDRYLFILQKCFHIQLLKPFYANLRKELTKMPKVYINDVGMRNAMLNNFSAIDDRMDKGQLLENFIFNELRQTIEPDDIKYWRTADGNEIDFVIETSADTGFAIEAKWAEREFKASKYKKFVESYPNYPLHIRSFDFENTSNWALKPIA